MIALSVTLFAVALAALAWGMVTEHRQRRETGPVAMVPTLPFAWQAAMIVTIGLVLLRRDAPWAALPWGMYLVVLVGAATAGSALVLLAGRLGERGRRAAGRDESP